jgi:hypothetical protein
LFAALERHRWWGAIVGPHGSGKSTLLAALLSRFQAVNRTVHFYVLHAGERKLPPPTADWKVNSQVIVDGYEQLSWWSRWTLKRACRRASAGLLVTSHERVKGLTTLFTTHVDLGLAQTLARQLLAESVIPMSDEEIESSFRATGGNLRETWFKLYDLYESKRPSD